MGDIQRGTCKWFDSKKGFGFITSEDGTDLFVHQTEIKADGFRNLCEGEEVEFLVQAILAECHLPTVEAAGGVADITAVGTAEEAMEVVAAVMGVAGTAVATAVAEMDTETAAVTAEVVTATVMAEAGAAGDMEVAAVAVTMVGAVATVAVAMAAVATEGVTEVAEAMETAAAAEAEADASHLRHIRNSVRCRVIPFEFGNESVSLDIRIDIIRGIVVAT
ncbi:glycine-rich protein 2, putative [Eimeria mitis]|uniref:Glycine-rich protein 2, putative n=1 Tax=Eimeria mitis TaxID=44415 RepID=U6JZ55_9EIME|nr:glycine-rich protein 2, putative [Eimeria mitis]CDJ30770.1 glycine-rich protein 2, putative [Eimeria mitis]